MKRVKSLCGLNKEILLLKTRVHIDNHSYLRGQRLRWSRGSVLAFGSNPAEVVGFLRVNKNPQHVGGHGCLSVVIVVCCQVDVSATN